MTPKYKDPEDMQTVIDKYFVDCEGVPLRDEDGEIVFDKYGDPIMIRRKPPTITGLALALGFTSRQALMNYQEKKRFLDTITRAKARCEEYAEQRLFDRDGQRGAEFSLRCNFKWRPDADDGKDAAKLERLREALRVIEDA